MGHGASAVSRSGYSDAQKMPEHGYLRTKASPRQLHRSVHPLDFGRARGHEPARIFISYPVSTRYKPTMDAATNDRAFFVGRAVLAPALARHRRIRGVTLILLTNRNTKRCRTPEGAALSSTKGETHASSGYTGIVCPGACAQQECAAQRGTKCRIISRRPLNFIATSCRNSDPAPEPGS